MVKSAKSAEVSKHVSRIMQEDGKINRPFPSLLVLPIMKKEILVGGPYRGIKRLYGGKSYALPVMWLTSMIARDSACYLTFVT